MSARTRSRDLVSPPLQHPVAPSVPHEMLWPFCLLLIAATLSVTRARRGGNHLTYEASPSSMATACFA
jgi:hypothetical protein